MKWIGHAGCSVIAAVPLVYLYPKLPPALNGEGNLTPFALFAWAVLWSIAPDMDIAIGRVVPLIKHRGFLSHSLYTAIVITLLLLAGWWWLPAGAQRLDLWLQDTSPGLADALHLPQAAAALHPFCAPVCALLAGLSVLTHILGDALTVSGVPLCKPGQDWHIPHIGGHAAFDNYALNAIPVALALWLLHTAFDLNLESLNSLRHFKLNP